MELEFTREEESFDHWDHRQELDRLAVELGVHLRVLEPLTDGDRGSGPGTDGAWAHRDLYERLVTGAGWN